MALLIAYLIAGAYVSALGFVFDPPPLENHTPAARVLISIVIFILLSLIWPVAVWEMAKKYPGREEDF